MGLDWNPLGKPKPGAEAEFAALQNHRLHAIGALHLYLKLATLHHINRISHHTSTIRPY